MNKVKLACDLQSLSRNVIMLVLLTAAVIVLVLFLVPVQWFLARKSYICFTMFYLPILPAAAAAAAAPPPHFFVDARTHDKKFFQGKFNH